MDNLFERGFRRGAFVEITGVNNGGIHPSWNRTDSALILYNNLGHQIDRIVIQDKMFDGATIRKKRYKGGRLRPGQIENFTYDDIIVRVTANSEIGIRRNFQI